MKLQLQDISDSEFSLMHESVLRLLSEFGVLFENQTARDLLVKAGNKVDEKGRIHLSEKFVESMLEQIPENGFTMYGRDESKTLHVAVNKMAFRPSTGAPFILDYQTKERRDSTMDDARMMVRLTDALDGYDMVNSVVSPTDAPGGKGNLSRFANAHRYSLKPSDITVMTGEEVNAIGKIASAIRGGQRELREKPLTAANVAMITPLRCANEQAEAMMECARLGMPVEVLISPSMGMTSPITVAGSAVVAMAEMIAAVCLMYLIEPGLGIISATRLSPTNMRTTAYNYGAPELGIGSVVFGALSNRYYIPTNLYGLGTVAKVPGGQASLEKTFSGLLVALGRPHMITGPGMLDNAIITSPEQLVIDNEAIRFIKRICRPIEIDQESIALEVFMRNMSGEGVLLAEDHTLKHLRAGEMIDAGLGQWVSYSEWQKQGCPDLFDLAHEKVKQILAEHTVEPFDGKLENHINRIVEESDF